MAAPMKVALAAWAALDERDRDNVRRKLARATATSTYPPRWRAVQAMVDAFDAAMKEDSAS